MEYKTVVEASDVTPEILKAAEGIIDGWYAEGRIGWEDFLYRLDGMELEDGFRLDLGGDMMSPAIKAIRAHVRKYRNS